MNMISTLLPCLTYESGTRPSENIFCCLVERVVDVVKAAFTLLAQTALAVANLVLAAGKFVVKTVSNTLWCVLGTLGCVSTSGSGFDYSGVTINPVNLNKAPEPFDLSELDRLNKAGSLIKKGGTSIEVAEIEVAEILKEYRSVVAEYSQTNPRSITTHDETQLQRLVDLAKEKGANEYQRIYRTTLEKVLQNIILELRRPSSEIPIDKKMRALDEIIEAQAKCGPRRLEECLRQYKLLKTSTPEMEQLLLEYIQNLKEECILEAFQDSQFHVLNSARTHVGVELGLNVSVLAAGDPYINSCGHVDLDTLRYEFSARYTPEAVVEGVMARIHLEGNNPQCLAFIKQELDMQAKSRGEDINNEAVAERIIQEAMRFFNGSLINQHGVIFLLRSIGILNPA